MTIGSTTAAQARVGIERALRAPYRRSTALALMALARDPLAPRDRRNLAILALEHLILRLSPEDLDEHEALWSALGIRDPGVAAGPLPERLRAEGYASTEPRVFLAQFRRRLHRLDRVHRGIAAGGARAWGDWRHLAGQECKLTLARYLIRPAEVVDRARAEMAASRGLPEPLATVAPVVEEEAARALLALPAYEREIARALCVAPEVYWRRPTTPDRANAPVEAPPGTVVTVVKPPGSDLEIEIKRTGMARGPLLDVRHTASGEPVPPAHRLQGGVVGSLLLHEARAGAALSEIYRAVHGRDAPLSRMVGIKAVYAVPGPRGETDLIDYFTCAEAFGPGYEAMRATLGEAVTAFDREARGPPLPAGGALGLTSRWLAHVAPKQGVLAGSSAWRLDRLARYLSPAGPDEYFGKERGLRYCADDARRLADDLLDEVLGVHLPPERYRGYRRYLEAAFALPANRRRADCHFAAAAAEFGTLWGTLLAARGYSTGESFVGRNVGLKSTWRRGRWRVALRFMDSDGLHLGHSGPDFHPLAQLHGVSCDAVYLFGWGARMPGSLDHLGEIYRAPAALRRRGRERLFRAARVAYRATRAAIVADPRVGRYFHPRFVARLDDWDAVLGWCLESNGAGTWEDAARRRLRRRGHPAAAIDEYLEAAGRYLRAIPQLVRVLPGLSR